MLESGAVPISGICVFVGGFKKQDAHSANTAFRKALAGEKVKTTLSVISRATPVPWGRLALFEQPSPSPAKSSQPISESSRKPGRMPVSITATMTPAPVMPEACRLATFATSRSVRYPFGFTVTVDWMSTASRALKESAVISLTALMRVRFLPPSVSTLVGRGMISSFVMLPMPILSRSEASTFRGTSAAMASTYLYWYVTRPPSDWILTTKAS
jgi:hypothetical protein